MKIPSRIAVVATVAAVAAVTVAVAANDDTELASVNGKGKPLDRRAGLPSISADGRYVGFTIDIGRLSPGTTEPETDVWVYDSRSQDAERVSGSPKDRSSSFDGSISADGRYVAFTSTSERLVSASTDTRFSGRPDIFVYDRKREKTELISQDAGKGGRDSISPAISADGRYVAFSSNSENLVDGPVIGSKTYFIHVYDRQTDKIEQLPSGFEPSISADGDLVAFYSSGGFTDEIPKRHAQTRNHLSRTEAYVYDRSSKEIELVSIAADGTLASAGSTEPDISADGTRVAFSSAASDLVAGDSNEKSDVFVRDLETGTTELVSAAPGGAAGNEKSYSAAISPDGSAVAFVSAATDLVTGDTNGEEDVFVRRLGTDVTVIASDAGQAVADGLSYDPALSSDGRFVAFESEAKNLTEDDGEKADVFLRDLGTAP